MYCPFSFVLVVCVPPEPIVTVTTAPGTTPPV